MSATVKLTTSENRAIISLNFVYSKDATTYLILNNYIHIKGQWQHLDGTVAEVVVRHIDRVEG